MNDKIGELAKQVSKIRDMAEADGDVVSVTIRYNPNFDHLIAEIHIMDPLPGMSDGVEYAMNCLKKSVDIEGVDVFCLIDKEEEK